MGEAAREAAGAVLAEAAAAPECEQLELIGLPASVSAERQGVLRESAAAGRRGRPPGAQNLATREVKEFCRKVFGYDPMIEGFRWLQHTPETLSTAIGCTRAEAFDKLEAIRRDLMRYFYAPMQPVDELGRPVPFFNLQIGANAPGEAARPPWIYAGGPLVEGEQNQEVSAEARAVSHDPKSHGDAK